MSIQRILEQTLESFPDGRGLILIGQDGLPVERAGNVTQDIEALAIECITLLGKFNNLMTESGAGEIHETLVRGAESSWIISAIDDSYYLFLNISPSTIPGQARYYLKKATLDLRPELNT